MNVFGTVIIKLQVSTDIEPVKTIGHDVGLPNVDMDRLSEDFQQWAEDEYGHMFDDKPLSIETELE